MNNNVLLLPVLFGFIYCQTPSQTLSCALPSLCRDGSIIDPRILSPGTPGALGPTSTGGFPGAGTGAPGGGGAPPGGTFPGGAAPSGGGAAPPGGGAAPPGGGAAPPGGSTGIPGGTGFPGSSAVGPPPASGGTGAFPGQGTGGNLNVGIVSPTACPPGYIRCSNVACGTPTTPPSAQDGLATPNAFPWQVFLRNNNNLAVKNGYAGGGVLLDQYHVLTAAHKISNLTSVSVLLGVYNTGNLATAQTAQVAQVWIHSLYNQTYLKNDVALLRLATPININTNAMPICQPQTGRNYVGLPSSSCVVSGWGQTSFSLDDAPTQTLKQVHVPIVPNAQCTASYNTILGPVNTAAYLDFPGELCAGGQTQLDACTQDGGSPLVCYDAPQFSLVGLVLWGKNCGQPGRYGVYLNVQNYLSWIQCTIQCIQGTQVCSNCPSQRFL